jgi:hypothetical protein
MAQWIIFYDDGSSFTDADGPPENAPRDGVQVVSAYDKGVGRLVWHSFDFYCWQDGEWVPRSQRGLFDYLREPGATKIVLQGRAVAYRTFTAAYQKAIDDTRLPAKNGMDPREPSPPAM